jgi:hypothetical protein
MKLGNE